MYKNSNGVVEHPGEGASDEEWREKYREFKEIEKEELERSYVGLKTER